MSAFHFLRPYALMILIPFLVYFVRFVFFKKRGEAYAHICDVELLPYIIEEDRSGFDVRVFMAPMIAGTLLIIALAGPTWKKLPQPLYHERAATMIVFDLSESMNETDVTPSRLERAKFKLQDFLTHYQEGQIGLVVFSSMPFLVSPLTYDANTIATRVNVLATDLLPVSGRNVPAALEKARELLASSHETHGDILLISSAGVDEQTLSLAREIHHNGYRISVLGVSSLPDGVFASLDNYMRDSNRQTKEMKENQKSLRSLATVGGGLYQQLTMDDSDIAHLQDHAKYIHDSMEKDNQSLPLWADGGYWFILFALPFFAYVFRRGFFSLVTE